MEIIAVRHVKRTTVRETSTRYLCYDSDIEHIRRYIRNHRHEKYSIETQKWAFDTAYIIRFYPNNMETTWKSE